MKNLDMVSLLTVSAREFNVPLYYSIREDAVYPYEKDGAYYVTDLIRFNAPKEIEQTVRRFMSY